MSVLPMPPTKSYGPPAMPRRYFRYVWDTVDKPRQQEGEIEGVGPSIIFTPLFENLVIYGREVTSPYEEDLEGLERLKKMGRVMGEWFSTACPEGEIGSQDLSQCEEISVAEFSAAFQRGWA